MQHFSVFYTKSQFLCEQAIWLSHPPLLTHPLSSLLDQHFCDCTFFCSTHSKLVCLTPINHKLTDSGEAQLSIVFLVDNFKVFPYSISGVMDSFLYDIGVYSVQYMLLLFFAVNNCHVILMLFDWLQCFHYRVSFTIWTV